MSKRLADLLDLLSDDRRSLPGRIGALVRTVLRRDRGP
jgi:hypothetical protein